MQTPAGLGLGLAAVARPAYITTGRAESLGATRTVEELRQRTWELFDAAYELGVRYVDAARSYGRAEEFLAGWLAQRPRAEVVVGSKWGYRYVGDWRLDAEVHEVKDHSVAAFTEQSAQSQRLLGEHLAIYHVHSATPESGALDDAALHRALAGLRDRGVRVGLSTSGPHQAETVRRALDVRVGGQPLFTSVQSTWNALEPAVGAALAEARAAGAVVILKEAVANGRLAPGGADGSPGVAAATALAARCGVPLDQLAIAHALAQPWASCVLSGATTVADLTSNAAATALRLDADVLAELAALAEPAGDYWAARARRSWS